MTELAPATIDTNTAIFNPTMLGQLTSLADLMSQAVVTVPAHLAGKPADCMAIAMQAMQWGMNPYAVAQKTHLVNGALGYEAQLVNAVISSSKAVQSRFHYRYGGDWSRVTVTKTAQVEKTGRNGKYTTTETVRGWVDADEKGLYVEVGAQLRGESEITWGEPVYLSSVVTRNSPLWVSNPKQQIAYLAVKYWARLYCPEVILGVYTKDELETPQEKDVTPLRDGVTRYVTVSEIAGDVIDAEKEAVNVDELCERFRLGIDEASTVEEAQSVGQEINSHKAELGATLHLELKNKAAKRFHQLKHLNFVTTAINEIPKPGEPDAVELFERAEKVLLAAKRHLGDDLHQSYSVTLNDMRPDYLPV
ncbi:RecT family recombinase [Kosakonia sp. 1610]|uniref:RecT family recombinase n=1 Tax=Kosakonia sp. 1610 TaxID=3156426 RepID=UPI003D1D744A